MNKNKYVFAQLVEIFDKDKFRHLKMLPLKKKN